MEISYRTAGKKIEVLDMDTQARLLEQLLSVMSEAGVDVLEYGIHHLVQSKTSEVKNGNELTITLRYKKK